MYPLCGAPPSGLYESASPNRVAPLTAVQGGKSSRSGEETEKARKGKTRRAHERERERERDRSSSAVRRCVPRVRDRSNFFFLLSTLRYTRIPSHSLAARKLALVSQSATHLEGAGYWLCQRDSSRSTRSSTFARGVAVYPESIYSA